MAYVWISLLSLVLCHLGSTQLTITRKCPSDAAGLVANGCSRGCITVTRVNYPCPSCNADCAEDISDECLPTNSGTCTEDQICLAVGVGGQYSCVNLTRAGGSCSVDYDITSTSLADVYARKVISKLGGVIIPCRSGLVCQREALETRVCRAVNVDGPCTEANNGTELVASLADCDEDGNYVPLQCRMNSSTGEYSCQCVYLNGTAVSDTEVDNLEEAPDCNDIVLSRCKYQTDDGISYSVESGETFVEISTCSRCLCKNGESTLCARQSEGSCERINPVNVSRENCIVRGTTIKSGGSASLDCNICKCSNGKLFCTRRLCNDDDGGDDDDDDMEDASDERICQACGDLVKEPVCGNDGKSYPSSCFAVNCRGLDSETLTAGSCAIRDVCGENPCGNESVCLKMGGVTCLSRDGCRPERLRRCVNLETLMCTARDENITETAEEAEGAVCGDDRKTYTSVCNLLQNSPDLQVMYAGNCNRTECSGNEVCGTDGETYANLCELQSKSANARVDYRGSCGDDVSGELVKDKCARLRESGKCDDLTTDCASLVHPGDGCCYICGGAVIIGLDHDAVDEYTRLNPDLETVDEFLTMLISSDFIPEDITRHCKIQANLLSTGSLHMVFESVNKSESICRSYSESIADQINNRSANSTTTTTYPQILQFATVAQPSPFVIVADAESTESGGSGGSGGSEEPGPAIAMATALSAIPFNLVMLLLTALYEINIITSV